MVGDLKLSCMLEVSMCPDVLDCVRPDGSLYSLGWYLAWSPGDDEATLDGRFSIEHLESIVAHMKGRTSDLRPA